MTARTRNRALRQVLAHSPGPELRTAEALAADLAVLAARRPKKGGAS